MPLQRNKIADDEKSKESIKGLLILASAIFKVSILNIKAIISIKIIIIKIILAIKIYL